MALKKVNAALGLLSTLALLVHVGYSTYVYLSFYYNPALKTLTALPFIVCACAHAVCGMCAVFLQGDGTSLDAYARQNRGTVVQRVCAALIFPLLIVHLKTYELLQGYAEQGAWGAFGLLIVLQLVFYAVVFAHTAASFSKALITLGLLASREKQQSLDRAVYAVCAAVFALAAFAVVRGQLVMFLPS